MELGLRGKKALITGGGKGIGREIAINLAAEGVTVCIISRTEAELKSTCEEINSASGKAVYRVFDLQNKESYQDLKDSVVSELGNIDILVNNAARVYKPTKLSHMDKSDWYKTIDVDLNAVFEMVKVFIDDMKNNQWGRIVTIGSLSGVLGVSNYPAYCAAKAALEGFSKNLAVDYSKYGITVNMVSPGFVETERFKKAAPKELIEKFAAATSVKRLGKPDDIADAVSFLVSERASYITGVNLLVCGGLNLGNIW